MKKRGIIGILLLCLLLTGATTACGGGDEEVTTLPMAEGDTIVSADGDISAPNQQELTFGTYGKIAEITVVAGDKVVKGQVLASLNTMPLERDLKTAQQAVKTAELAIQTAEIDKELAMNTYTKLTYPYNYHTYAIDVPSANALNKGALTELNEAMALLSGAELSDEQYRDVMDKLKRAQNNLVKSGEHLAWGYGDGVFDSGVLGIGDFWTLRAAQLQADKARLAVDTANNSLEIAVNSLAGIQDNLENTVIVAPFDGTVSLVDAKEGEFLTVATYAGKTIVEIVDLKHMELIARVSELDIAGVKIGQKVMISVDAMAEVKLEGQVAFISPLARDPGAVLFEDDDEEKEYEVKISFDIPENLPILVGMSAIAEIIIE
jgi:multidrug resistance efflux pump